MPDYTWVFIWRSPNSLTSTRGLRCPLNKKDLTDPRSFPCFRQSLCPQSLWYHVFLHLNRRFGISSGELKMNRT